MKVAPNHDDTIAWVTVRLHSHGACSISGTIGERDLSLQLLAHAADTIKRQAPREGGIIIPNCDVDVSAPPPHLNEMGDLALRDRGDP
jgi:hypothetical protein